MKKEEQTGLMHDPRLGKRQRHADKTGQALPQRVILPLHMGGFSSLFAHCRVLFLREGRLVCRPKVREAMYLAVGWWNGLPQLLARLFTPIPNGIRHHLTRLAAQGNPHPAVVRLFEDKRAIRSSSSSAVDVGSSGSGASRVVRKGGS